MELYQLKYFLYAAKYENISKAAQALRVSQPSISRAVVALEKELQVELFERQGKRIVLTRAGLTFREQISPILWKLEGLGDEMKKIRGGVYDPPQCHVGGAAPFQYHKKIPGGGAGCSLCGDRPEGEHRLASMYCKRRSWHVLSGRSGAFVGGGLSWSIVQHLAGGKGRDFLEGCGKREFYPVASWNSIKKPGGYTVSGAPFYTEILYGM